MVSNVDDLLKWLKANMNVEDSQPNLKYIELTHHPLGDSIEIPFIEKKYNRQGIVWWYFYDTKSDRILAPGGTTPNHTVFIAFNKTKKGGIVVYTNLSWSLLQDENESLRTGKLGIVMASTLF